MNFLSIKEVLSSDNLKKKYGFKKVTYTYISAIVRSSISDEKQASQFVKDFALATKTGWIVKDQQRCKRLLFSKKWHCFLSKRHKTAEKRNADCPAYIRIQIKDKTRDGDPFLREFPNVCATILLTFDHSHNINSLENLQMLPVCDQVAQQFREYFSSGMTLSEARQFHSDRLLKEGKLVEDLVNTALNPSYRQARHLFSLWERDNTKPLENPFEKLTEKIPFFNNQGAVIKMKCDSPWAVTIVTPIMLRAQSLDTSKDVIFVDSTVCCRSECSITLMLTVTSAGAVPIAVLIHENQTFDSYWSAFSVLKDNFPNCFGGYEEVPDVFMTEDSEDVHIALLDIWPGAKLFLSQPKVVQAQWRWLYDQKTPSDECQRLMEIFERVMYAEEPVSLDESLKDVYREINYPEFVVNVANFMERKSEWVSQYRKKVVAWNHTQEYAEDSTRLIKDVIIQQTKGYNLVAMAEFFVESFENYLKSRLLEHTDCDTKKECTEEQIGRRYLRVIRKLIAQVSEHLYLLPDVSWLKRKRQKNLDVLLTVDTAFYACSCESGILGGFCRHLKALFRRERRIFAPIPTLNSKEKDCLVQLALGLNEPPAEILTKSAEVKEDIDPNPVEIDVAPELRNGDYKKQIEQEFSRISALAVSTTPSTMSADLLQALKSIRTKEDVVDFINWGIALS